jgi:hypothetical protein
MDHWTFFLILLLENKPFIQLNCSVLSQRQNRRLEMLQFSVLWNLNEFNVAVSHIAEGRLLQMKMNENSIKLSNFCPNLVQFYSVMGVSL